MRTFLLTLYLAFICEMLAVGIPRRDAGGRNNPNRGPHFIPASRNDDIADAVLLKGTNVTAIGAVFGATLENNEPLPYPQSAHSVWFKWVAPEDGRYTFITTSADMNPLMSIYRDLPGDTLVDLPMNGSRYSQINFPILDGELFYIAVDGIAQDRHNKFTLNVRRTPPPLNDSFANRLPLIEGLTITSNEGATTEPGEPHEDDYRSLTLWWHFTPATSGWYTIQARVAITSAVPTETYFEHVSLYTGDNLSTLQEMPSGYHVFEDAFNYPMFLLTAGTNYVLEVVDWRNRFGEIRLTSRYHPRPANDDFVNAIHIPSEGVQIVEGSTIGATPEAGDPSLDFFYTSVWWRWTAPSNGVYALALNEEIGGGAEVLAGSILEELLLVPRLNEQQYSFQFEAIGGLEYYFLGLGGLPGFPIWFRLSPFGE